MVEGKRGRVVILWHMHQPPYRSPLSGEVLLPWTLTHAMRDYYDMPLLAQETGARVTFNLVPSLVEQLEDYASVRVRDAFLRTALIPPDQLSRQERRFLVENFFAVHPETMLKVHPRYAQLASKAMPGAPQDFVLERFTDEDIGDLQVWFFLAWAGESLRSQDEVSELMRKGAGFSQEDKETLVAAVSRQLARTIPLYQELVASNAIEVSTSPHYHPILPLLVSTQAALEADAAARLPAGGFSFPDDARRQIEGALDFMAPRFGGAVRGMWPSEGAVSEAVCTLLDKTALSWVAADEGALLASRKLVGDARGRQELLYQPWQRGKTMMLFRDARLSDLLGFKYSRWDTTTAADHFVDALIEAIDSAPQEHPVVTIAMDGENAWEYYVNGGYVFLRELYQRLVAHPRLELCTPGDLVDSAQAVETLSRVAASTWIDGSFGTWIGDPTKNLAWEHLASARNVAQSVLQQRRLKPREEDDLRDLIHRAEASDWFWWFGEGHSSPYDVEFDALFRHHLKAIYRKVGTRPPLELDYPLVRPLGSVSRVEEPVHRISPRITGKRDSYYKWLSAGRVDRVQGFLHRPRSVVQQVRFGFDESNCYFKIEAGDVLRQRMQEERFWFTLRFLRPEEISFRLWLEPGGQARVTCLEDGAEVTGAVLAVASVLELALPISVFGHAVPWGPIECALIVAHRGREVERFPQTENIVFTLAGEELDGANWHV